MPIPGRPISHATGASAGVAGVAIPIPNGSQDPWIAPTAVKVWVSADAFIGFGSDDSPPAAAANNTAIQQADSEEVYMLLGIAPTEGAPHVYVYARTATIGYDVSFFG